jgi:hypothetical protein
VFRLSASCLVCKSKNKIKIDTALINGESIRKISQQFSISESSIYRHSKTHLPKSLSKAKETEETRQADRVMVELNRCLERANLLFDSCHDWLTDPANPEKYTLSPRDYEIDVIYHLQSDDNDKPIRRKAPLSQLLAMVRAGGVMIESWESKVMDPRKLILDTIGRLSGLIEILNNQGEFEKRLKELEKNAATMQAQGTFKGHKHVK